ncbi:MAG: addiction module protein [Burkholderiales bacterium RIFCSPHIGHO2_12_FULL_61_11]|nr:MAG: addiction module protein [Burkholderiales bacterium RIFCSPHIGHO2_12_FULL_61_11]
MSFDRQLPFNDLPLLPPPVDLETKAVLKQVIAARTALAELKGAAQLLPNQGVLIQAIGLQEAKLSSEIENIVTTNDDLFRGFANDGEGASAQTKEVLRYKDALWQGHQWIKQGMPLTTRLFETLYQTVKQADDGVPRTSGTKLANPATGEVVYCPPEGETVIRDKLANLERFINEPSELDPLVRMAVMHYQFEAIHPFPDGNGRVGRILNILQLQSEALLDVPILYLSGYIIENKGAYYRGLTAVTERGEWEAWVLYMLRGVETMAHFTRQRIRAVMDLMQTARVQAEKVLPKVQVPAILDVVFRHPYCKVRFLEEAGLGSRPTCTKYLRALVAAGLLREQAVWRENYFINDAFFEALAR